MSRHELFRTAPTEPGRADPPHRLVLARQYGRGTAGYVVGKVYHDGGPLIGAVEVRSHRGAALVFGETLRRSPWYRPEAVLIDPAAPTDQWLTIHLRDGSTLLVSALSWPGQRFWVSTGRVRVVPDGGPGPALTKPESGEPLTTPFWSDLSDQSPGRQREIWESMTQDDVP